MMEDLAQTVFLMTIVPGALVGLLVGFARGLNSALISTILGALGGFAGAMGLTQLVSRLSYQDVAAAPYVVVVGSILGAIAILAFVSMFRRRASP